jgi:hypothetical protein
MGASGYNEHSRAEAAIGCDKQVIGNGLRLRQDGRRTTEIGVVARVPDKIL